MTSEPTEAPLQGAGALIEPDERDFSALRGDFPALAQLIHGKRLVYLDSAASSQMPQQVLDALMHYHATTHSNVHRAVHTLSQRATRAYERARSTIARFINAPSERQCVFVRGATEGLNLVAYGYGEVVIKPGDAVIVSAMEHHANIVPWQLLCERRGAELWVLEMDERGELCMDQYRELLARGRAKIVAVNHVSNALGTINPVAEMAEQAHRAGAVIVVDGCQATPHMEVDVQALDADFYAFSGHKMYAPTGIGVLYGKMEHLERMQPFMSGGDMIDHVSFEQGTTFAGVPERFEAGTPSIAAAVALGRAAEYITAIGRGRIAEHESYLLELARERLGELPGLRLYGRAERRVGVVSFDFEDVHPQDIGTLLDTCGVAVRTGRHCAEPVMKRLGIQGTARASFALYNGEDDVEALIDGLKFVREMFA